MRKLCPNFDRDDALETVLEVPIPDEMFANMGGGGGGNHHRWQTMRAWMKSVPEDGHASSLPQLAGRNAELQLLLNVVGSPLVPFPVPPEAVNRPIRDCSIRSWNLCNKSADVFANVHECSANRSSVDCFDDYSLIRLIRRMFAQFGGINSEIHRPAIHSGNRGAGGTEFGEQHVRDRESEDERVRVPCGGRERGGQWERKVGAFVLWQKNPDLWYLELVVSGCKVSAGSDGKVAWRQFAAQQSHASKGPPRSLRRSLQGLDPRLTANLFSDAVCIGEKIIKNEDCFILKLEASPDVLKARSSSSFEIIHHTIWGYFSQRTGLLVKFEDSHLLRMKARRDESVFWETSMESEIDDYRYIEGLNIAHRGRTVVTLFRYGEGSANHKRKMEEEWSIEEVDFNIWGLSMDCFLPPADLKREQEGDEHSIRGGTPLFIEDDDVSDTLATLDPARHNPSTSSTFARLGFEHHETRP
ncbi:hypothetical protein QJS10_CPA05g01154 [Acorus calamus]|uniref:Uncharacterized protein n=1 Tax=Acorus calamus TaxID=4465 RepID=A0AAV9EU70_ACOCL|nr:hypothetical protein QJS10_CPA05g01154 [Acorus calamus]